MRFLSAKASLVSGQKDTRQKKIEALRNSKNIRYNVNNSNFDDFVNAVLLAKEQQGDYYVLDWDVLE